MALEINEIQSRLEKEFGTSVSKFRMEYDILTWEASPEAVNDVIRYVHTDETLKFNFLTDLCGVHYPDNEENARFAVVYLLHNWVDNVRIRIKTFLNGDNPQVASATNIFESANWMERETYDFYGIKFIGHPNLVRILNVDSMVSFPMRKEYPLEDAGRTDKDDRFFGRTTDNK